jgi:hypothetical protein
VILAILLAVACTADPVFTPTPVVVWDQVADANLAGYSLWYREPGGTFQRLRDFPCEWYDTDRPPDGMPDVRFCRGADLGIPLQRYCPSCAPLNLYEFAVKARNLAGAESATFSNVLPVCYSPICARPGPCN